MDSIGEGQQGPDDLSSAPAFQSPGENAGNDPTGFCPGNEADGDRPSA